MRTNPMGLRAAAILAARTLTIATLAVGAAILCGGAARAAAGNNECENVLYVFKNMGGRKSLCRVLSSFEMADIFKACVVKGAQAANTDRDHALPDDDVYELPENELLGLYKACSGGIYRQD